MGMKSVWLSPLASLMRRSHEDDVDWDDASTTSSDSRWRWPDGRPLIAEVSGTLAADPELTSNPARLAVGLRARLARLLRPG